MYHTEKEIRQEKTNQFSFDQILWLTALQAKAPLKGQFTQLRH